MQFDMYKCWLGKNRQCSLLSTYSGHFCTGVDGQTNVCCLLLWVRRYFEVVEVPSDGQPRMRACPNLWSRFNLNAT